MTSSSSPPAHTQEFEDAITVKPLSSHTYQAYLSPEWCIGTVPHGGYTTAVLHRLSTTHFKHTHPSRHSGQAYPISMQLTFLRRTAAGPAILTVTDAKLGARTSTIHVELAQQDGEDATPPTSNSGGSNSSEKGQLKVKVAGYITVSDPVSEQGLSALTDWTLLPPPPSASATPIPTTGKKGLLSFSSPPRLDAIERNGTDGTWRENTPSFAEFRKAANHTRTFGPDWQALSKSSASTPLWRPTQKDDDRLRQVEALIGNRRRGGVVDQWSRLRTTGPKGGEGKWTNEGVAYLGDLFPTALEGMEELGVENSSTAEKGKALGQRFWFPTVTLNIDFKKPMPPGGVEWIYSRVTTKRVRNGRTDIEVVLIDLEGDVVAICTQVGLIMSASRNIGKRSYKDGPKGKL